MARRSQCSSAGDNPLDPNFLPPHYREEYRLAIDALIEADLEGYYGFLQEANVVDFLSRPEIEYIKGMVQVPCQRPQADRRYVIGDGDGSSDTYWPIHSDLDAPGLDLGWPQEHRFAGPTEITTLVNPSDPEMPSIKEQVRRMIKNAQQVVAVAMDMFTDVDIFADILNAAMRNVPVYVLLDEVNAHHFVAMVNNCRVNLDEIKSLRVRTVSGSTYFCHTGKSFKGQMMNRFILVDCKIVLSGNYSFMWSFEKINRCMAHVFIGQFVATFDEEFRILFAQSEPLVAENAMRYVEDYGNIPRKHKMENTNIFMREHPPVENIRAEWPGHSFEDHVKVQPNILSFRRGESVHSSTDEHIPLPVHASQQFREEHSFLDQRRMKGPNKDMGGFRRHGYTGVPNYSQINTGHRGEQNIEGLEISTPFSREQYFNQRTGPEPGYEMYGASRDYSYNQLDQYPGPEFPHELGDAEPPGGYDHVQRYLHSCPTVEKVPAGNLLVPIQSPPRRHSMGQSYTCQTSPTQPNLPEQKHFFNVHHKRQDQKEGLRDWRISSYLTALQHSGLEDMADLQRTGSFDNAPHVIQGRPCESEISETRQDSSGFTKAPTSKLNVKTLDNLSLPEKSLDCQVGFRTYLANAKQTPTTTSESSCTTEGDKQEEPKESNLTREESFRRRPNLALQRSSRLRHSLIFSSNLEQHTSDDVSSSSSQNNEDDILKKSTVVSNILEKKRPDTRKPFQWSSLVKPSSFDSTPKTGSEDLPGKTKEESAGDKGEATEVAQKDSQPERALSQRLQPQVSESAKNQLTPAISQGSLSFIDMNDPECRLRYFKELAAKRKAELAQTNLSTKDKVSKEPNKSKASLPTDRNEEKETPKIPQAATALLPASSQKCPLGASQESNTKALSSQILPDKNLKHKSHDSKMTEEHGPLKCDSSLRAISTSATDAEKIKLKQQLTEEHDSSLKTTDNSASGANPGLQFHKATKPSSQLSPIPNVSSQTKLPKVIDSGHSSSPSPKKSPTDCVSLTSGLSQHLIATGHSNIDTAQQHTSAKETGPSQHPTSVEEETGNFQHSAPAEKGNAKQTETTVHTPAAETVPSQPPSAASLAEGTDTAQHTTVAKTGPSQPPSAASLAEGTDTAQHTTVAKTGPSQPPSAASLAEGTDTAQHTTVAKTGPSQPPSAASLAEGTDTAQHTTGAETGLSQPPNAASHADRKDTAPHTTAKETVPSQPPSTASHAEGTDTAQHTTEADTGPSQPSSAANHAEGVDTAQHTTAKETGPSQPLSEVKTECTQHQASDLANTASPTTASPEDLSTKQQSVNTASTTVFPPETSSDVSLMPTETGPATSTLPSNESSEHTACDLSPSVVNTPSSEMNSPNSKMPSEKDLGVNASAISVASTTQTDTTASTEDSPVETSSCSQITSSDQSTLAESESCKSLPETSSLTNTTKTDDGASQKVSLTNTSSLIEHSKGSEPGEASTESPCPLTSDKNPSPLMSLSSVTDNPSHSSAEVCQPVNLQETEIQTVQHISCPPDPKEESKDKDQNGEPTKEQTLQQEASVDSTSHVTVQAPSDLDNDSVNKIQETTTDGTSGGSNNAEQSPRPQKEAPCTDLANQQPPAAQKPTHQSSTINVLSCSNLRDDTKVLLEQISAKNQGRASKMSLADSCDTKEEEANGTTKQDQKISGLLQSKSKIWSSKTTPEERENLLKKIESMRKEKRVYSRFQTP
ncbi:uncharacterized protein fam83ha [Salminus brasiliensis]|uniref:uncharacterized protein fam83ha n=1 Tax=Salminus brasiliensis TaxID=930266 RepID=UPI003B835D20